MSRNNFVNTALQDNGINNKLSLKLKGVVMLQNYIDNDVLNPKKEEVMNKVFPEEQAQNMVERAMVTCLKTHDSVDESNAPKNSNIFKNGKMAGR